MKAKLVKESLSIKGDRFESEHINRYDKILVGINGILIDDILVRWEDIDELMKKYRK